MDLNSRIAYHLTHPSGLLGRWILPRAWNYWNAALNDAAFAALEPQPDDRIVEVGFGGGYLLGRLAQVPCDGRLAGVDAAPGIVAYGRQRFAWLMKVGRLELACAPADSLPYPDGAFNKACSVNSLFYWPDAALGLAELARVLCIDGWLVLCLTDKAALGRRRFAQQGLTLYDRTDSARLLAEAGFDRVEVKAMADRHRQFLCIKARKEP